MAFNIKSVIGTGNPLLDQAGWAQQLTGGKKGGNLAGTVLDPIFGTDTSSQDAAAQDYLNRVTQAYSGIDIPELSAPDVVPYQDLGLPQGNINYNLSPAEMAAVVNAGPSAYQGISADPRLQQDQYASLNSLREIADSGGLTQQDLANLNKIQSQVAQEDRSRRDAILQQQGARGMAGSGNELLAMLDSSQAATQRANQSGLDIAGLAEQRALDALSQGGQLAGNIRAQDFGEKSKAAEAQDAIARFNAANANQIGLANQGALNQASLARASGNMSAANANLNQNTLRAQNSQSQANLNTGLTNQRNQAVAALPQQNFQNKVTLAAGRSGAAAPGVSYYQGLGDRESKKNADYMNAIITGGAAAAKAGG